ncbi:MAG: ABC transporter substrate-binding protein [Oscillospiraceae bacterium]|nr:ABC transporter substrate-binding protein [Oscillospiraceae bacterium]
MRNTKKIVALLLACLMIVSVVACGGKKDNNDSNSNNASNQDSSTNSNANTDSSSNTNSNSNTDSNANANTNTNTDSSSSSNHPDRTLNIASMQDSGTLYPLGVTGGFIGVLYGFYEPLWDTRLDGSRKWVLATGYDMISDLEYTLTLREGIKFSNGNAMTAEDVMFSMELCSENPQFALNVKVIDFEKTKVTSDYTIDVWYTEFNASQEPGFPSLLIMDKESYDELSLSMNPIGTGPYVVTDYVVNSHLTLKARDDYWGGEVPIKNIQFKVINEDAQVINALEVGEIDMASIPVAEVDYVKSLGYSVTAAPGGFNMVTMFSMLPGQPLESKEARWAVCHAIDRQAIADILFNGMSTIVDYPGSANMIDYEPRFSNLSEIYSIGYNPQRARELAEQTGLIGKTIRIITNGSTAYNTIAEIVQGGLLDIGVNAEIINYDQATYFPTMMDASNFEIAIFNPAAPSWMAVDVLAMYLTFIPLGWSGPDRDLYGELSMGAIGTANEAERQNKLFEAIKMFSDLVPWYGLCESVGARAQNSELVGVEYFMPGSIYYQDISWK